MTEALPGDVCLYANQGHINIANGNNTYWDAGMDQRVKRYGPEYPTTRPFDYAIRYVGN